MSTSDFLMILSIFVALITVTAANNKKLWLYKFSWWGISFCIATGIAIHFFIFYYDFRAMGMCPIFECEKGIRADYWGYVISVLSLLFLLVYVIRGKYFPKSNWDKIVKYYSSLIDSDPTTCISYIRQYHLDDLKKEIQLINRDNGNYNAHKSLGQRILREVICSKRFIEKCVIIDPELFFDIVGDLKTNKVVFLKNSVDYFLHLFFKSSNLQFGLSLRNFAQYFKIPQEGILKHLFPSMDRGMDFIQLYDVWDIFAEEAENNSHTFQPENKKNADYKIDFQSSCSYYYLFFFIAQMKYFHLLTAKDAKSFYEKNKGFSVENCMEKTFSTLGKMVGHSQEAFKDKGLSFYVRTVITVLLNDFCIIGENSKDDEALESLTQKVVEFQLELATDNDEPEFGTYSTLYPLSGVKRTIEDYLRLSRKYSIHNPVLSAFYFQLETDASLLFTSFQSAVNTIGDELKKGEAFQKLQELFRE